MTDWKMLTVRLHPERDAAIIAWLDNLPTDDTRGKLIRSTLYRGIVMAQQVPAPVAPVRKSLPAPIRKVQQSVVNDEELTYTDDIE